MMGNPKRRIASVGYLNARPLTAHLDPERYEVVNGYPAQIAALLESGEVDAALVPVVTVLDNPDLRVLPGVCIGARGPVDSVLLVGETPPETWNRIVLDGQSRTSAALVRVLLEGPLAERLPGVSEVVAVAPGTAPEQAVGRTGALVIGDAARTLAQRLSHRIDLSQTWTEWTGHGFVFAVWAVRTGTDLGLLEDLRAAAVSGRAAIERLDDASDRAYLANFIRYDLDDSALIGLRRFAALAYRAGLVATDHVRLLLSAAPIRPRADVDELLVRAAQGELLDRGELLMLATDARTVDLMAAADALRQSRPPQGAVSWRVAVQIQNDSDVERARDALAFGATELLWCGASLPPAWLVGLAQASGARLWADGGHPLDALAEGSTNGLLPAHWSYRPGAELPVKRSEERRLAAVAAGLDVMWELAICGSAEQTVDALLSLRAVRPGALCCWAPWRAAAPAGLDANTAIDHLRGVALCRLALPSLESLRAAPSTEGRGMAGASLRAGADHFGTWVLGDDKARWPREIELCNLEVEEAGFSSPSSGSDGPRRGPRRRTMVAR
jgi:predicted solute-binding protein